jgi:predicted transcriptional regulator
MLDVDGELMSQTAVKISDIVQRRIAADETLARVPIEYLVNQALEAHLDALEWKRSAIATARASIARGESLTVEEAMARVDKIIAAAAQ